MTAPRLRRPIAPALTFVLAAACVASTARAQVQIDRVVRSYENAPGTSGQFTSLGVPSIASGGVVLFSGAVSGGGPSSSSSGNLYTATVGSAPTLIVAAGDAIPGGGATYLRPAETSRYALYDDGRLAFGGSITGGGYGLFAGTPGGLATVARTGQPAPGLPAGATYATSTAPIAALDAAGNIAFATTVSGGGVTNAIFHGPIAAPSAFARTGDQAVGLAAGITYSIFSAPAVSRAGTVAWDASLAGPGVEPNYGGATVRNDQALYVGTTAPTLVLRSGTQAPGRASGVKIDGIGQRQVDDNGRVVFGAGYTLANTTVHAGGTLYDYNASTGLRALASEGQAAPGLSGLTLAAIGSPVLGRGGALAFQATLGGNVSSSTDNALYLTPDDAAVATLIARENDAVPGAVGDVRWSSFDDVVVNAAGQLAFTAMLRGTGVTNATDRGLFVFDPATGTVRSIVREGDLIDAGFGASAVTAITFRDDNLTDAAGPFAADGRLTFGLSFAAGPEGIYVATVPEPATFSAALSLATLAARRRRR